MKLLAKFPRLIFLGCLACTMLIFTSTLYMSAAQEGRDKKILKQVEQEIKKRNKTKQALEEKASKLARQQKELQKQIILLAATVQASAKRARDIERALEKLTFSEADMILRLQKDREKLATSLAALQRFEKQTPPALAVRPDDALAGLRGQLAIASIVPTLQQAAHQIKAQLDELNAIRTQMNDNQTQLKTETARAAQDKIRLAGLMAEKKKTETVTRHTILQEKAEIHRLARQARSLRDLVKKLEARRPSKRDNLNFRGAKGRLPLPVSGRFLPPRQATKRNADLGREGGYIKTRPNALVTAPFDASIQYAGVFRDYGTMLIMSVGRDYHLLIAGLDGLDVEVGQNVLAGEPVGRMANIMANIAGENTPIPQEGLTLYLEVRYKGQPLNLSGWFKKS